MKYNAALSTLLALIETIEATGGVKRDEKGSLYPVADPDWLDLADVYQQAKLAVSQQDSRPHLILFMDGGVIHEGISNLPVDWTLIDYDTDGLLEDIYNLPRPGYGDKAYCLAHSADVKPDEVEALLSTIEQQQKP